MKPLKLVHVDSSQWTVLVHEHDLASETYRPGMWRVCDQDSAVSHRQPRRAGTVARLSAMQKYSGVRTRVARCVVKLKLSNRIYDSLTDAQIRKQGSANDSAIVSLVLGPPPFGKARQRSQLC
jgi:hypothetical protein